jgi:hypothetical protein
MNGPDISFHFRSIDVGDKDISDIKVAVPRTKTVYGRLVVEGEGPMPIINYTFGLDADGPAPIAVSVTPECNGSFAVRLPEGDHRVSGSLPAGFLRAFTYGSTNLLRERLRVSAEDSMELRITLAANSTVGRSGATLGGGVGPLFFGLGSRQRIPPCPS